MRLLGLIPARRGSKGIPRKNLVTLAGRPLLAWTVEAALHSERLDRVVVSTDSPEIAEVARSLGAEVPFLRPADLATDEVPMLPVVAHAIAALSKEGYETDGVVLLQPTSPLRSAVRIDEAVQIMEGTRADAVVSVVQVPHRYTPGSLMRISDGRLEPYESGGATRRQDKPVLYARNGPAVLVTQTAVIRSNSLYGQHCRALIMRPDESVDIDDSFDLLIAELLLLHRSAR